VLAAGFIGQFGKRLADHLVARGRDRRARTSFAPPPGPTDEKVQGDGSDHAISERRGASDIDATAAAKMAKKADKVQVKRLKKTPL
jgi:hypothetical protein